MMGCSPDGTAPAPGTDALPACSVGEQHDAQPLAWANAGDPPVHLVHGDQDGIAPPDQAYYYKWVGTDLGLTITADIVAGAGHNLAYELNLGALENFIDSHIGD